MVWRIEFAAESAEQAARLAYDAFVRPGSFTHLFEVTNKIDDSATVGGAQLVSMTHTVDLDGGWDGEGVWDSDCGPPASYPMAKDI